MSNLIIFILAFIIGGIVGYFIGKVKKSDGMFIVDDNDYEKTRWILDVKIDPKTIPNKKEIRLKVHKINEGDV